MSMALMRWLRSPVSNRFPVRWSTVLLIVAFIGLVVLYLRVRVPGGDVDGAAPGKLVPTVVVDRDAPGIG